MIQIYPVGSRWGVKVDFPGIPYSWAQETHEFANIEDALIYIRQFTNRCKWANRLGRFAGFLDRFDRRF